MFDVYYKTYGIKVNYQSIGSGGGVRQLMEKTVDFGASDAFLSDEELKKFPNPVVHVPITVGAVVIAYNLPGNPELRLTPSVLVDIFMGKIKKWNDRRIKELNPDVDLPGLEIIVVYRSDGSGTTFIFTDYLCKISDEWKKKIGKGKSVKWLTGIGAKGNEGVSAFIKQTPGAIGYIELAYALQNNIPFVLLKNKAGRFVKPSVKSVSLAADIELPNDMRISLTNTSAEEGYPISGFTWIIVYRNLYHGKLSYKKAKELVKLLWWMIHDGQKYCEKLHYAPLSEKAVKKAEKIIRSIVYKGTPILKQN
jgi:phosphate transport system substrate-binding protein